MLAEFCFFVVCRACCNKDGFSLNIYGERTKKNCAITIIMIAKIMLKNINRLSLPNPIGNGPMNPITEYFVSALPPRKMLPKNIMKNPKIIKNMPSGIIC